MTPSHQTTHKEIRDPPSDIPKDDQMGKEISNINLLMTPIDLIQKSINGYKTIPIRLVPTLLKDLSYPLKNGGKTDPNRGTAGPNLKILVRTHIHSPINDPILNREIDNIKMAMVDTEVENVDVHRHVTDTVKKGKTITNHLAEVQTRLQ